jgi:hypothetical protein
MRNEVAYMDTTVTHQTAARVCLRLAPSSSSPQRWTTSADIRRAWLVCEPNDEVDVLAERGLRAADERDSVRAALQASTALLRQQNAEIARLRGTITQLRRARREAV